MNRFILELPGGSPIEVGIEGNGARVHWGSENFAFTQHDLQGERVRAAYRNGLLMVTSPRVQGCFSLKPSSGASEEHTLGQSGLRALFPGKVIKVLVKKGSVVEGGTDLLVMESMKMEYHYKSPRKLVIDKVLVREGQSLAKGEPFFEVSE